MKYPDRYPRTVSQVLKYRQLINEATCQTIILCGTFDASRFPMALANARAWDLSSNDPLFWVPYLGISLSNPMMFDHIIVDPSFDNQIQKNVDWFERCVADHLTPGCKVTHIAV